MCEQQRSCSPGFRRKELHATESAVEVRRARRRLREAATDERVGLFTPDKDGDTADGAGRVPVLAARRGSRDPPSVARRHVVRVYGTKASKMSQKACLEFVAAPQLARAARKHRSRGAPDRKGSTPRSLWGCNKLAAERATEGVPAEVMECET